MTLIITGWAWFQTYFKEFGIDIDSLNSDGSLGRIEYYLSPGAKSFGHLISGKLSKNINEYFFSEKFFGITVVFLIILLMYTLMRVEIHREKREDDSPKADLLPAKDGFKFFFSALFVTGILILEIFAPKLGEWTAIRDVRNLNSENLPRVQLLLKSDTTGVIKGNLTRSVFRKVFMDKSNIHIYSESEEIPGRVPPIYVIGLNEITRIRLIND